MQIQHQSAWTLLTIFVLCVMLFLFSFVKVPIQQSNSTLLQVKDLNSKSYTKKFYQVKKYSFSRKSDFKLIYMWSLKEQFTRKWKFSHCLLWTSPEFTLTLADTDWTLIFEWIVSLILNRITGWIWGLLDWLKVQKRRKNKILEHKCMFMISQLSLLFL